MTVSGSPWGSLSFARTGITTRTPAAVCATSSRAIGVAGGAVQLVAAAEAVAVRVRTFQTRLSLSKGTVNAPSLAGDRPGANEVGWPRSLGSGLNVLSVPSGITTGTALSFW